MLEVRSVDLHYGAAIALRQVITNLNQAGTSLPMRFVPTEPTNASGGGGAWWRVEVDVALPPMTDAAETLGLHRSNLYRKMRQLGMQTTSEN